MMRSMFSGVSGLKVHQTRMDVIGNNVANVNTVGFKSGRVTFHEVFNQTLRGASAPDTSTGRGGINPMQIGLGLGLASIDTIMTRGNPERTDNPTDLSIEGDGFFIVRSSIFDAPKFTRAGNFTLDKLGFLNLNGMNVQGWMDYDIETGEFNTEGDLVSINLYEGGPIQNKRIIPPKVTDKAAFSGNLNSRALSFNDYNASASEENQISLDTLEDAKKAMEVLEKEQRGSTHRMPVTVYDKLGNAHELKLNFVKQEVIDEGDSVKTTWFVFFDGPDFTHGTITFDAEGKLDGITGLDKIIVTPQSGGTDSFEVELNFDGLTGYSDNNSVKPTDVNGYPTGSLVNFSIGSDGIITGIYSNGEKQPLGMIALASFDNPAGLQKLGENLFLDTPNSGSFVKRKPGAGVGLLNPGTLEMSNVDLSREFTDMIITQRGFQANSRIITTSDEMLQELVNIKR